MAHIKAKNSRTCWSVEDKNYVRENYGIVAMKSMMRILGRSELAISAMAYRIFGTSRKTDVQGYFTTKDIANFFSIDTSTVTLWINNLSLPVVKINRVTKKANMPYAHAYGIDYDKFWSWLKTNKDKICVNLENVDLKVFDEDCPDWFMFDYRNKLHYGSQKRWSKDEEKVLFDLYYKANKSTSEIAQVLSRTTASVNKKIARNIAKLR